jgi:hypothetical protein
VVDIALVGVAVSAIFCQVSLVLADVLPVAMYVLAFGSRGLRASTAREQPRNAENEHTTSEQ